MNGLETVSEEVILKAMEGDEEAFTEIYRIYNNRVYFFAVQFFKNEDTAKDIVQEVFLKVHRQIHSLKVPKAFSSWLHVITYRECQNTTRRKTRVYDLGANEHIENFEDFNKIDIMSKVENERIKAIIVESLENMKVPLRTVAVLRFFEELKVEEIAEVMDIPKSTVSTRLMRIKKILKEDLVKNGIYKNYSIAILSPVIVHEAYKLLSEKYNLDESVVNNILHTILAGGAVATAGGMSILAKMLLGGLISGAVIGGAIVLNNSEETEINGSGAYTEWASPPVVEETEDDAEIESIEYDTNWRNTTLQISVNTTNDNYDKILINDIETLLIKNNGMYVVKLVKDDEVIDQQEIEILNIDRYSPTLTNERNRDEFILYLDENVSGIDWNSIQHYKNGELCYEYTADTVNNIIIVKNDNYYSTHEIYVSDNAGNVLNITIE